MTDSPSEIQVMNTTCSHDPVKVGTENGLPSPENHYTLYENGEPNKNEMYSEYNKTAFSDMRECETVSEADFVRESENGGFVHDSENGDAEKTHHPSVVMSLTEAMPDGQLNEGIEMQQVEIPLENEDQSATEESIIHIENGESLNENEQNSCSEESHMDHVQNERMINDMQTVDYPGELQKDESVAKEMVSSRSAAVICMGTSSPMYELPEGKGLPPVSTIIRSTARFDRTIRPPMGETHLPPMSSHRTPSSSPVQCSESPSSELCNMGNMERFSPHRSVVVTTSQALAQGYSLSNNGIEMGEEEESRLSYIAVASSVPSHYVQEHVPVLQSTISDLPLHAHIKEVCNNIKLRMAHDGCSPTGVERLHYNHSDMRKEMANEYVMQERHEEECHNQAKEYSYESCMPTSDLQREQNAIDVLNSIIRTRPPVLTREQAFDDDSDHMLGDMTSGNMDSTPSNLIISPSERHVGRITVSASFSGDDSSDESSPMISMDSDMESKVQDLTRQHCDENEMDENEVQNGGTPNPMVGGNIRVLHQEVHGMPTGVIMSALTNSGSTVLHAASTINDGEMNIRGNPMSSLSDEAEAEDLSHRSKVSSDMHMDRNSHSDDVRNSPATSPLPIVSSSMLPSFLSASSQALLSISGLPLTLPTSSSLSYVPPSQSGLVSGPIPSAPPIVLSGNISSSGNLPCIKQEPIDPSESNACINSTVVTTTNTSNSIINNSTVASMLNRLPSLSPFFKHEHSASGSTSLPPYQVISAMKKDLPVSLLNNQHIAHTSSSSCNFPQSRGSLVISGVHLPSLNIPHSPMSDSPGTSPLTASVPSLTPTSLSPVKKSDKPSDMRSQNVSLATLQSTVGVALTSRDTVDAKKWCCIMCRNGSPCGLHPTQPHVPMAPLSGDPSKPYQCNICGKHLASKNVFQLHMRAHSGEKPFKCNLCGHHFSQKTSLTRHMRSHTGERPFPCGVCGKRFADKERIKIHMRTHTGEKPFPCDVCGKRFSQKSTVKRHMSVHTGEKPFKCEACGKGFANRGNLNAHSKTHANS